MDRWKLYAILVATCIIGLIAKTDCLRVGHASWTMPLCYTDAAAFWSGDGVPAGRLPYLQSPVEYPVLTGLQIWVEGVASRALFGRSFAGFVDMIVLANTLLAAATLELLIRTGVSRARLFVWAASPLLILYVGINWDMAAALMAVCAIACARRHRFGWSGIAIAVGASAKFYPVVLLPAIAIETLCMRDRLPAERIRDMFLLAGGVIITWVAINAPVAWLAYDNWSLFYKFSRGRPGNIMSVWSLLSRYHLVHMTTAARNVASAVTAAVSGLAILVIGSRTRPNAAWTLATPLVAVFIMTSKVWSAQFDLWLLPLALITCRNPWPILVFITGDVVAYVCEFRFLEGAHVGWPHVTAAMLAAATGTRVCAMVWIAIDGVMPTHPDRDRAGMEPDTVRLDQV